MLGYCKDTVYISNVYISNVDSTIIYITKPYISHVHYLMFGNTLQQRYY